MLAGTLQPDNVSAVIHQLRDIIAPDMANELSLTGGTITEWRDNVEGMEVFARLRNEAVPELLARSDRFTFRDPGLGDAVPEAPP